LGKNSKIDWTEHSFNPWVGCQKVSEGCVNCYAETWGKRTGEGGLWASELPRLTSKICWNTPRKLNRLAEAAGQRMRIFCASLADVFDDRVPWQWREDLWTLISETPWLDWLVLTKRPENFKNMLPGNFPSGMEHVWLGVTVEDRAAANTRVPILRKTKAAHRFLSCEPLLASVPINLKGIDVVVVGGETGTNAREMDPGWARDILLQCRQSGVPFFMKQMSQRKEIPPDLMVREFPGYSED